MKYYISLIMILCFANFSKAQDDFDSQWKAVAKFEKEGLTKSAAKIVDTIFNSSKEKEQSQQRIKALLYKSKYMLTLEEEAQLNIIDLFKSEIELTDSL